MTRPTRPVVFLHIPKTAGQTIHYELCRVIGANNASPVRVHTQVADDQSQMPRGYGLYSGHIDWHELEALPNPFTFSVLRNPEERIASFYFYLLKEAQALSETERLKPEHFGKHAILQGSASTYFFDGNDNWQHFVRDHYDNFYCSYFATRKMRGWREVAKITPAERRQLAVKNLGLLDGLYSTTKLGQLESDFKQQFGFELKVSGRFENAGDMPRDKPRWPQLLARLESDKHVQRLAAFAEQDWELLQTIGVKV